MLVREVMQDGCKCCGADDSIETVARLMAIADIGALPVTNEGQLAGIVTDRDLVVRGLAVHEEFRSLTASDVMTEQVYYCFDDEHCARVAEHMAKLQVRRMPVVTRDKALVGLVSLGDLARGEELPAATEALQGISADRA